LLNHLGDLVATEGCSDLGICHSSAHKWTARLLACSYSSHNIFIASY
jgi:hypothetical protein